MTTLPQQATIKQYLTDGLETEYTYPFMILTDRDIAVYLTLAGEDPNPTIDKKVLTTDYTVTNAGEENGGTIIFNDAPPALSVVTLSRAIEASVDTNFENASTFNGANLDAAFLRTTLVEQQNQTYALRRNLSYKVNSYLPDPYLENYTQLPVPGNGQIWIGQENGVTAVTLEENPNVSVLRSDLANDDFGTDGARIIGYHDDANNISTTVHDQLVSVTESLNTITDSLIFKPGMMIDFAGTEPPEGWLLCDGSFVSKTIYADLFAVIGTIWGPAPGSTFTLPDFRRRVAVGSGGTSSAILGNATGNVGGEEAHTQTEAELFGHAHPGSTITTTSHSPAFSPIVHAMGTDVQTGTPTLALSIANQGGGQPFNIIQPSAVVSKIIKY